MSAADLTGAVVVVMGASGAAGPPAVAALAARGATAIAVDRDAIALSRMIEGLPEPLRASVVPTELDLLDEPASLAWGHELATEYGRVDGLIHLVGGWRGGKGIVDADLADYDWLHDGLVRTLQHATRALHDPIAASPFGRIVIVSTTALDKPTASNAAYLTAKAAAEMWMRAVANSYADIRAAAVILRAKALLTPKMREDKPTAKFSGYTPVAELAERIVGLFDLPADEINGTIIPLVAG